MSVGHRLKLGAIALSGSLMVLHLAHRDSIRGVVPASHPVEAAVSPIYFSPGMNLEDVDLSLIDHAHRAIDVAIYTFTDRRIAEALRRAAERGVLVRVYRDREEYEQELLRDSTVPSLLAGEPRIRVKVKNGRELMHEKAMLCDDSRAPLRVGQLVGFRGPLSRQRSLGHNRSIVCFCILAGLP